MKLIKITLIAILVLALAASIHALTMKSKKQTFQEYIADIKKEAHSIGVSKKTTNKYLNNLKPPKPPKKSTIHKLRTHQAEAVLTFKKYKHEFLRKAEVKYAARQYHQHYQLLKRVEKDYHVQPQFIVTLWGIESDYGRFVGNFPLIRSLAVLGYQDHRAKFYRRQLIDALVMLNRPNVIPEQLKSAWDGGMGQTQFEPAAYLTYAVDYNKDGFANIWTSLPDVFASIANFLHKNGWNGKQNWGISVKVPANFPVKQADYHKRYRVSHWKKLGVRQRNGKALPNIQGKTSVLLPDGIKGEAFLVYPNFKVLMRWNDTTFEQLSVGILSDRLAATRRKK